MKFRCSSHLQSVVPTVPNALRAPRHVANIKAIVASKAVVVLIAVTSLSGCNQGFQRAERADARWDGRHALEHHDWEKAIAIYSKLIDMNPRAGENYQKRAEAYFGDRQFDKALADYRTANNLGFHSDLQIGRIELTRGNFADAATSLQTGLDRSPNDPVLEDAIYCGFAYKLDGKKEAADKVLNRAADNYAHDSYVMAHKDDKDAKKYIWEKYPYSGLQFARGKMTADELLGTVKDDDYNFVEAHALIALNHLAINQEPDAVKEFEWVRQRAKGYRYVSQLSSGLLEWLRKRGRNDAPGQSADPENERPFDQGAAP